MLLSRLNAISTAESALLLPGISIAELALIAALAAVSAITGGVAGYGTGALMPLILVPIIGAAPRPVRSV